MSSDMKVLVEQYAKADEKERLTIVDQANNSLSNTQMKNFKKEIKRIQEAEKQTGGQTDESSGEEGSDDGNAGETPASSSKKSGKAAGKSTKIVVTEKDVENFWQDLESQAGDQLFDEQVLKDFQYIGFNPNVILRSIMVKGSAAGRTRIQMMNDISQMCTIAVIKGSITELNLKKMSDEGKVTYGKLEATYALKKGGSKGVDPEVITIARVGAAFPGAISKILMERPELAKTFAGPFGSKVLPPYLRHQSAAACIPDTLADNAKTFLLGLITAFTSDQSKVISKTKDKPEELYERQENFINQTNGSFYPTELVRKELFKRWTLVADYDKLNTVATNIGKHVKTFESISKDDLTKAFNAV